MRQYLQESECKIIYSKNSRMKWFALFYYLTFLQGAVNFTRQYLKESECKQKTTQLSEDM